MNSSSTSPLAWNWDAQPELNDPSLKSPRPCTHGANCLYDGCCGFVHPGEEGTGRKLFAARTRVNEDGNQEWEPAVVRLIGYRRGQAGFYERRRLRLSWSAWCKREGLPTPVRIVAARAEGGAASHKRREVIDLGNDGVVSAATTWADVARRASVVAPSPVQAQEPAPAPAPAPSLPTARTEEASWGDMMLGEDEGHVPVPVPAPVPAAVVQEQVPVPAPVPVVQEQAPAPVPQVLTPFQQAWQQFNYNVWMAQQKLSYAQPILSLVAHNLDAARETMLSAGITHPVAFNPFLITTYFLTTGSIQDLHRLTVDTDYMCNVLLRTVDFINLFPRPVAAPSGATAAPSGAMTVPQQAQTA
jgi:hypothetical protein